MQDSLGKRRDQKYSRSSCSKLLNTPARTRVWLTFGEAFPDEGLSRFHDAKNIQTAYSHRSTLASYLSLDTLHSQLLNALHARVRDSTYKSNSCGHLCGMVLFCGLEGLTAPPKPVRTSRATISEYTLIGEGCEGRARMLCNLGTLLRLGYGSYSCDQYSTLLPLRPFHQGEASYFGQPAKREHVLLFLHVSDVLPSARLAQHVQYMQASHVQVPTLDP